MSKTICMICLRTDFSRTEDIDDSLIEFYEELVYFDMLEQAYLQVCSICEHLLRKFYNFRQKCRRGLVLLKSWSAGQKKRALQDLQTVLPRSPISICTSTSLQKLYVFGWSDAKHDTEQKQELTECLLVVKPINKPEKKDVKTNKETKFKTDVKTYLEGFLKDTDLGALDNDNDFGGTVDDGAIKINKNLKSKKTFKIKTYKKKRPISIKTALKNELKALEVSNPAEHKRRMQKLKDDTKDKRKAQAVELLKNDLLKKIEDGMFNDIEDLGVTMTKDVFLKVFDKCTVNSMLIQGVLNSKVIKYNNETSLAKQRRFLTHLLKRYNPEFESIMEVEYLDTDQRKVEEFQSRQFSKQYLEAHHRCELCFKVFEVQGALDYHTKLVHKTNSPDTIKCSICPMRIRKNHMTVHMFVNHTAVYRCKLCPFITYNNDIMKSHYHQHKGVTYSCPICQKVFKCLSTMLNHKRVAHLTSHICAFCALSCASSLGLQQHISLKHKKDHPELLCGAPRVPCAACPAAFHSLTALHAHRARCHPAPLPAAPEPHKCFFCKEVFPSLSQLQAHKKQVEHRGRRARAPRPLEPYATCTVCNEQVANESRLSLFQHYRKAHPDVKYESQAALCNYLCEQCGRAFKTHNMYRDHLNSHSGAKPYECSECSARFGSYATARVHVERHGAPRYPCERCSKRFPTATARYLHMRIHIGDRRFKCDICPKDFLHAASLRYHIDAVHKNIRRVHVKTDRPRLKRIDGKVKFEEILDEDQIKTGFKREYQIKDDGSTNEDQIKDDGFLNEDQIKDDGFTNEDQTKDDGFTNEDQTKDDGFTNEDQTKDDGFTNEDQIKDDGFTNEDDGFTSEDHFKDEQISNDGSIYIKVIGDYMDVAGDDMEVAGEEMVFESEEI